MPWIELHAWSPVPHLESANAPFRFEGRFLFKGALWHIQAVVSKGAICVMITILRSAWWPTHTGKKPHC